MTDVAPPPIDPLDHLGLVAWVANAYRDRGADYKDLRSEGFLGLLEAIRRYDPDRGATFATFAVHYIRLAIREYLRDRVALVRTPAGAQQFRRDLDRGRRSEAALSSRRRESLAAARRASFAAESLSDADLAPELADARTPDPSAGPERDDEHARLRFVLAMLPPREEAILRDHFGVGRDRALNLREIGDALGLTRERVRRIEARALERLRALVA